jgi:hypothetical protein
VTDSTTPPGDDDPGESEPGSDEWFDEVDDDITLDRLGNPDATDDLDDVDSADRDITDMLGAWRDDAEATGELVSTEEAAKAIADAKKKHDDAKRSRENPDIGGSSRMAISDDAAQLNQMGEDGQAVVGQLAAVNGRIDDAVGIVDAIAIALDDAAAPAVAASDYVTTVAGVAQGLLGGAEGDQVAGLGNAAAAAINDVTAAVMSSSAAITTILAQVQSVRPVVDTAQQMVHQFFEELKAAAQRHGS